MSVPLKPRAVSAFGAEVREVVLGVSDEHWRSPCIAYSKDVHNPHVTKIMHYEFSWMTAGRYFILSKDTAFTWHIIFWTMISCVVSTLVGLAVCPADKKLDPYWGSKDTCLPLDPNANWLFMTTLVSFLLTIFTSMIFNRWWNMREKIGGIMGRINNIVMCTASFIPGDGIEVQTARRTIGRYLEAVHELAYATFRKEEKDKLPALVHKEIITPEELSFLETAPGFTWSILLGWISQTLRICSSKGWLVHPETMLPYMVSDLQGIRGFIGETTGFLTTQIPYPYVQLLVGITKVHIFLVHIYAAALVGPNIWIEGTKGKDKVVLGYCVLIFNCLIYNALLRIADMMYNPFGDDRPDFPIHAFLEGVKKSVAHTLRAGEALPPVIRSLQLALPGAYLGKKHSVGTMHAAAALPVDLRMDVHSQSDDVLTSDLPSIKLVVQ